MADGESSSLPAVNSTGDEAVNATARRPATTEGMALAYGSLVVMALLPIFIGALRSVRHHKEQKVDTSLLPSAIAARRSPASSQFTDCQQELGEKPETMTTKDAAMFPIIASCTLFGIYIVFKIFSKEYINLLLTIYFFGLGVLALAHVTSPYVSKCIPSYFPNREYHLIFNEGKGEKKEEILNYEFDRRDLICLLFCCIIGVWYLMKKHWIANNLFGLAFAVNGVELLSLNKVSTGCILLGGLFIYDIFWVFGTNVMVSVAKSFEAPIKLVFPQDLLEKGLAANNFAMLGLGDIVIPGIFIALLLRFDVSLKKNSRTYFYASFLAYILGLVATILVMHVFKHAQPALLYLVPACIGLPLSVALLKGEIKVMFNYEDHAEKKETETSTATTKKSQ